MHYVNELIVFYPIYLSICLCLKVSSLNFIEEQMLSITLTSFVLNYHIMYRNKYTSQFMIFYDFLIWLQSAPGSLVEMVEDHNQDDKVDGTGEEGLHDQEEGVQEQELGLELGGQVGLHTEHSIVVTA